MAYTGCKLLLTGKVPPPQSLEPLPHARLEASQSLEGDSAATSTSQLRKLENREA